MGIQVIGEEEALRMPETVVRLKLGDIDFSAIARALDQFGVRLDGLAAVAVAVFDHGNAPVHISDRQFRFDYLDERIRAENRLSAFAFRQDEIPPIMTRLQSALQAARSSADGLLDQVPMVVMDTAPAAVLGATFDPVVSRQQQVLIANVGNFHTLAFRLGPAGIEGVFEHHTGLLDLPSLERLLYALADGSLRHEDVFGHQGHGALIYDPTPLSLDAGPFGIVVTGPRRGLLSRSALRPYFAVPFGDMMIAGCFGLLAATADKMPELGETILPSLRGFSENMTAPWDVN
jgi:uncharacterized protein (DUF1786 family)